jgi:NAD(P)H-dependent flavin oxidoreductase YrpB (nitropropane dioxygenase family)
MLARKASGRVDGFIVEGPTAGGHNAPPRGAPTYNELGEPVYGARDVVDLNALGELGLPFWLAGGAGHPDRLHEALQAGAAGIQVGTLFAYCDESGFSANIKETVLAGVRDNTLHVRTDPRASPTGYPFKVVRPAGAEEPVERERLCDLGGLRVAYRTPEGGIGYRCAAEPVDAYIKKGGSLEDTVGRQCLCNALSAAIDQAQVRTNRSVEPPLITSGDDLQSMGPFLGGRTHYSARDVINWLSPAAPAGSDQPSPTEA